MVPACIAPLEVTQGRTGRQRFAQFQSHVWGVALRLSGRLPPIRLRPRACSLSRIERPSRHYRPCPVHCCMRSTVVMSSSVDSDAAKKGDALIPATTDHAQSGDGPRMLTEKALLRLEEALRAQHKQAGRQRPFSAVDAATSQPGSSGISRRTPIIRGRIEQIAESPPLAPGTSQSQLPTEQHVPSRSSRRRKVGLVLCSLLLVLGPAFLEGSLKSPTGGLIDVAPINNEPGGRTVSMPPDNSKPPLSIPNMAKSPATESASSPPGAADQQPVEAQSPRALETPMAPAPSDERAV